VWEDANTLRKRPVFRAAANTKKTTGATVVDLSADDDEDAACDIDIQVIKVVESHASEIARSGNTSKYFGSFLHKFDFFLCSLFIFLTTQCYCIHQDRCLMLVHFQF
jgi:hypothetical protein